MLSSGGMWVTIVASVHESNGDLCFLCGSVAEWLACCTCNQQVAVQILAFPLSSATLGKLLTHVPLSPSSVTWYQPMGDDALRLERCLASQWPHVTNISGSPSTGSRPRRGIWASDYALFVQYGELYLFTITFLELLQIRLGPTKQKLCTPFLSPSVHPWWGSRLPCVLFT